MAGLAELKSRDFFFFYIYSRLSSAGIVQHVFTRVSQVTESGLYVLIFFLSDSLQDLLIMLNPPKIF